MVCATFPALRLVGLVVVSARLRLDDVFCSLEVHRVDVLGTSCIVRLVGGAPVVSFAM